MIEISGQLTTDDYVSAQFLHFRPRTLFKVAAIPPLFVYVWAMWYSFVGPGSKDFDWLDLVLPAGGLFVVLNFFLYIPWRIRRTFEQRKSLHEQLNAKIDDSGLRAESSRGNANMPWSDFMKWKENDRLILMYISDHIFLTFPKRFFQNNHGVEDLRDILKRNIGASAA